MPGGTRVGFGPISCKERLRGSPMSLPVCCWCGAPLGGAADAGAAVLCLACQGKPAETTPTAAPAPPALTPTAPAAPSPSWAPQNPQGYLAGVGITGAAALALVCGLLVLLVPPRPTATDAP